LCGRGVEDGELGALASDGDIPGRKHKQGTDEVVEGIEVVQPVSASKVSKLCPTSNKSEEE
jgi:hypothetical protein